jgi:putative transposase
MLCGLRCRAYPTDALQAHLRRWIGHQRFIKNAKTSELAYFRAFARSALFLTGRAPLPDQAYSQFITERTAFLREVPSHSQEARTPVRASHL